MDPHNLPDISLFRSRRETSPRFNDVDILGHVNNTVYFSFYDTGKAYYFHDVKEGKIDWRKVETVIANVNCAYISSILFGETIEILTRCKAVRSKSFVLEQMLINKDTGEVKSICETVMVTIDRETLRPIEVPDHWRTDLCRFEGRDLSEPHQ